MPDANALPPALEFWNIPWKGLPKHNEADLIAPRMPPGGLLGGGEGKGGSKLKALASKRKQKTDPPTAKMQELKLTDGACDPPDPVPPQTPVPAAESGPQKQKRPSESTLDEDPSPKRQRGLLEHCIKRTHKAGGLNTVEIEIEPTIVIKMSATKNPSAFGQTLCGPAFEIRPSNFADKLPLPFASSPLFNLQAFQKPSPDDVVLAAQAKAGQKVASKGGSGAKKQPASASAEATVPEATHQMAGLQVTEQLHKGKKLDVANLYQERLQQPGSRQHASFVVVGHIDAGKSTTMGRLLLDLGCVDSRTIEKYKKEATDMGKQSFALAWVLDTVDEERARGVTIDVAMKDFKTDRTAFTILDAPGHQDFVPNMIAGAGRADFGIVVIDGNTGAFEKGLKGQTNEHILLLRSFGVQRLIIATNKLDMVDWSQERFDEITNQLNGYVSKIGFKADNVTFVPISGLNGDNVVKRSESPSAAWYTGPTLVEALEEAAATTADAFAKELHKPFRLPISETYKSDKGERLICGRLTCGTIQVGDHVAVQPSGESGHIKGITVSKEPREWAVTGENVEISFSAGVTFEHISWGDVVCPSGALAHAESTFTLRGLAFEHMLPMPLEVHRGRLKADGQIVSMPALLDKATGEVIKKRPKMMQAGAYGLIKFTTAVPVALEKGQRIVLRANGKTIAAGVLE
jgi:elongation factor 1 alpha-like protein